MASIKNTANVLDESAVLLGRRYLVTESELLEVLAKMDKARAFQELGFKGTFDYVLRKLKFSESQAYYYSKVIEKSREVPVLKEAVVSGELTLSQARRIAPLVTKENASEWIEKAVALPQRDLEFEIKKQNPEPEVRETIRPIAENRLEFKCGISKHLDEELARVRDLVSQITQSPASLEMALEYMKEAFLEKHDPVRKAQRAQTRAAKKVSSGNSSPAAPLREVSSGNSGRLRRAARVAPGKIPPALPPGGVSSGSISKSAQEELFPSRNGPVRKDPQKVSSGNSRPSYRTPIPAEIRHAVMLRDKQKCRFPMHDGKACGQSRWTDLHHVLPLSRGGSHSVDNLVTLCSSHHRLVHAP